MGGGVLAVAQELNHTLVEKEVWVWTFGYRCANAINWEFLCPFQGGRESKGLTAARSEVGGGDTTRIDRSERPIKTFE